MAKEQQGAPPPGALDGMPAAPLTLEGSYILHQMFQVRWPVWRSASPAARKEIVEESSTLLAGLEQGEGGQSAIFSLLGHKGDLMLVHFRRTIDELNGAELQLSNSRLADLLEPTTSYLSVVELGLYEVSVRLFKSLRQKGVRPDTPEWKQAVADEIARQEKGSTARLWPGVPNRRYLSFYPMSKRRGESKNWYEASITERQMMMRGHGIIGRKYAGQVIQIISGSIGFDDWEWGVDLFADDPLVFKKLVTEMRFDEASAAYGEFGAFYVALRFPPAKLATLLAGETPAFS
jgi:hydrogen peroxide-dependent heme synthase